MRTGAKRISPNSRTQIENIKSNIRCTSRPFDGDGHPFKQALRELRQEGMTIKYVRDKCHYVKVNATL
ncbi:hypothetical protein [Shewanella colwelliana]|uniref:hypothetical protein n=1 Tax=Shewanella colwelliana TaxID=23 RepID=UPI000B348691|nr:hypothetical protein [Shewanella colwelliana]MCZ4337655.1 hypothetical protein [Shewanella colwelliana]